MIWQRGWFEKARPLFLKPGHQKNGDIPVPVFGSALNPLVSARQIWSFEHGLRPGHESITSPAGRQNLHAEAQFCLAHNREVKIAMRVV